MKIFTFTNFVFAVFAVYVFIATRNLWSLFYPHSHAGPIATGLAPQTSAFLPAVDVLVFVTPFSSFPHPKGRSIPGYFTEPVADLRGAEWGTSSGVNVSRHAAYAVRKNSSLFVHIFVTPPGSASGPRRTPAELARRLDTVQLSAPLTASLPCRSNRLQSLLGKDASGRENITVADGGSGKPQTWCLYLEPKVHVAMVVGSPVFSMDNIPSDLHPHLRVRRGASGAYIYGPIVAIDKTWLLKESFVPLNDTALILPEVNALPVTIQTSSMGLFRLRQQFSAALRMMEGMLGDNSEEPDNLRRMLAETHPALLLLTFVVTILHSLFDILAYKNDIQFWRGRKSMKGLSAYVVYGDLVCCIVIFLYLQNNDSGLLILVPSFAGVFIQLWKALLVFRMRRTDLAAAGGDRSAQLDTQGMRYLSYILYPLCLGYSVYSLIYRQHLGWYSWAIDSAASAVYAFGFALMTPQLYMNYRLKSVSQLPWRVFVYKALNTFIDDLFAFIIKMPTMHRLSSFRDDVIFVVYLYQRHLYPVDTTRQVEGMEEEESSTAGK